MIHASQRPFALHRAFDDRPVIGSPDAGVTVSPSRAEIRRADPSLSFQVVAPGARSFDVIVATDPSLFDPAHAHRRTPKNFRSSRQDFQGEPIEIETGFYLLPRAFLRDLVSVEPRPTRLYYVAAAYADAAGGQARYSLPPAEMARSAPFVTIAADLVAANLSKVLGVAVERLGAVTAAGRVVSGAMTAGPTSLPAEIGGLPLTRRAAPAGPAQNGTNGIGGAARPGNGAAAGGRNGAPRAAMPAANGSGAGNGRTLPRQPGNGAGAGNGGLSENGARPRNGAPTGAGGAHAGNGTRPGNGAPASNGNGSPAYAAEPPTPANGGFVDEDYAYGGGATRHPARFRDLDAGSGIRAAAYDDGFGPVQARSYSEEPSGPTAEPIPPLDPAPEPTPPVAARPAPAPAAEPMDIESDDALVQLVIAEGAGGRYDALSLDGGFRGRFGPSDPYFQRAHDGLRIGPHQAMQDTGELGELLSMMRAADPAAFDRIFGPEAGALIATTTADGPSGLSSLDGRGPRVLPVGGHDLWEEPWVGRFRAAAQHPPFQAAMRQHILASRLDPLRPLAEALRLESPRGLAMLLALGINRGVDGAAAHARMAVNPFDTPARLGAALDALGYADLGAFRTSHGLPPGDMVDAPTHFALLDALADLGPESPVQVPDAEAIMDALVTAAGPGALGDALLRLRVSPAFQRAAGE